MQFAGGGGLEHNRSRLTLIDARVPLVARSLEPIERLPLEALAERLDIARVANRQIPAAGFSAPMLTSYIKELISHGPSTLSTMAMALAREHLLDLVAVAMGEPASLTPRLGAATHLVATRLRAAIDHSWRDPTADSVSIAAAAGISERHARRILRQENTSIPELLIARRLAEASKALADPEQGHRSIGQIARACGFRNISHFIVSFKAAHGVTPRARRSMMHIGH